MQGCQGPERAVSGSYPWGSYLWHLSLRFGQATLLPGKGARARMAVLGRLKPKAEVGAVCVFQRRKCHIPQLDGGKTLLVTSGML